MSWSDLFYPGNPKRRADVVRLCTKLYTLIENNFRTTNELIDIMHKCMPEEDFQKITFETSSDIKTNVDVLIDKIREIQDCVEVKGQSLREILEPKLYETLVSSNTKFTTKIEVARKVSTAALATIGSVAGVALIGGIYQKRILQTVVEKLGLIRTAILSSVILGVLIMGVDMVASAIIGAVEKGKLNTAIKELEKTLATFEPDSYQFDKNIQRVGIYLEEEFDK